MARLSGGRIPWPVAYNVNNGGRGPGPYIVCGDLVRALRRESVQAIQHWWGAGTVTVCGWRRALGVETFNEGTRRLWSEWKPVKLSRPCAGTLLELSPKKMRARRLALGLSRREVAARVGWTSPSTFGQLETGRRRRATKVTLSKIAVALECRLKDLVAGHRPPVGRGKGPDR